MGAAGIFKEVRMKHFWVFFAAVCLAGCSAAVVYVPAQPQPILLAQSAVARGVLEPQGLAFTLVSQYQNETARVLILGEPLIKLADMTVSAEQIRVHYRAPRLPKALVRQWGNLVQNHFLTLCPAAHMRQPLGRTDSYFDVQVKGGVCP